MRGSEKQAKIRRSLFSNAAHKHGLKYCTDPICIQMFELLLSVVNLSDSTERDHRLRGLWVNHIDDFRDEQSVSDMPGHAK